MSASPPCARLVAGGGHVTSFWWAFLVFAMAVLPAATDFAHLPASYGDWSRNMAKARR